RRAHAHHNGSFVMKDGVDDEVMSAADNELTMAFSGGIRALSSSTSTVGVHLPPGGNAWSVLSDRAVKENLTPVDVEDVLVRLLGVPIYRYNLKSQGASIQHMGAVAQGFYAAFGLGKGERYIGGADVDGVLMAAVQALAQRLQERDAELARQRQELWDLKAEMADLKMRLALLESFLAAILTARQP
ncbi:MAG: tail fiber domain-containing protein, partial [Dehalococcoidia bacterium]